LAADEIIPLHGSPSDASFVSALENKGVVFDFLVSTTEKITNYFPHYNEIVVLLRTLEERSNKDGQAIGALHVGMQGLRHISLSRSLAP
jgi:hypothetical protein